METWYKVDNSRYRVTPKIEAVEVIKVTEKTVTVVKRWTDRNKQEKHSEDRCNKITDYHCFFPTWEEAHVFLMESAENFVVRARRELEEAKSRQGNIKGMKKPE